MSQLRVVPIVEGHGEFQAIRVLLDRIWRELLGGEFIDVLQPVRQHRSKLVKQTEFQHAVGLAAKKLAKASGPPIPGFVLVLIDADDDAACQLGPQLLEWAKTAFGHVDVACVVAVVEYETWFTAAAESLSDFLAFDSIPDDPEGSRLGKGWIEKCFKGTKYSETVDQPAMTACADLAVCRQKCPSFDKLCRELEKRLSSVTDIDSEGE